MAIRKRFIAGAKCPSCQAQDTLAMWRENNIDIVECVKCGHQMREADKEAPRARSQRRASDRDFSSGLAIWRSFF